MHSSRRPTATRRKSLSCFGLGLAVLAMLLRPAMAGDYPFQDPSLPAEQRVKDLLGRMSVDEKIAQMECIQAFDQYRRVGDTVELTDSYKKLFAASPIGCLSSIGRADWYSGRTWENGLTPALMAKTSNLFQRHAMENSRWRIPVWIADPTFHGFMALGATVFPTMILSAYNQGGKLPISFQFEEGQLPVYYNARKPRPNYIDLPAAPRLSFGFGLSYTTFAYSDIRLSKPAAKLGEPVTVSVCVKNTGALAGDEVVQLYIADRVASIVRPERELRGFRRVRLAAGETQTVTFPLSAEELGYYNAKLDYVVEPGRFSIAVGGSLDSLFTAEFVLTE
jgi:hypothetical protein